jgi:outer membrane protein assembly factor BamB
MVRFSILSLLILSLLSCTKKEQDQAKKTLYLTTSANDVYAFNLAEKKLLWHVEAFNKEENDEVNFFTVDEKHLTKAYIDGSIIQYDKKTGNKVWEIKDTDGPDAKLYNFNFNEVAFRLFYQYPLVVNGNIIFANSHGEIKSINIATKKVNWIYYNPNIIYSSPKVVKNLVMVSLNGSMIAIDIKTGKKVSSVNYDENEPVTNEMVIDGGNIFTLSQNNLLSSFTPEYNSIWDYKADNTSQSSTHNMLITDKAVYFGGSALFAVDKEKGELLWKTELYKDDNALLSVAKCDDGVMVSTRKELLKLDDDGKIITRKKLASEAYGILYLANNNYYYVCQNGVMYSIDAGLQHEAVFYKGINIDPEHRVDNTYMFAE